MKFIVYPTHSYIYTSPEHLQKINKLLSFRPQGYYFSKKYRQGVWDGWYHFLRKNKILTGLLYSIVIPYCKENNIKFLTQRKYELLKPQYEIDLSGIELRDYQKRSIYQLQIYGRGILELATGAGKTEAILAYIKSYNKEAVIFVHTKELLYQTADRISNRLKIVPGIVGDGQFSRSQVTVVTIQTFASLRKSEKEKFYNIPILVLDECHHYQGTATRWHKEVVNFTSSIRIGLSATPLRENEINDWYLMGITGPVIGKIKADYLIDKGYLVPPKVIIVRNEYSRFSGSYYDSYQTVIVDNESRHQLIKQLVTKVRKTRNNILVLVDRKQHGKLLQNMIKKSIFLSGDDKTPYRKKILKEFKKGKFILITTLLGEGVDIPEIDALFLVSPIASETRVRLIQRVGRGLRIHKDKKDVLVIDIADVNCKYFLKHLENRKKIYDQEKFKYQEVSYNEAISLL